MAFYGGVEDKWRIKCRGKKGGVGAERGEKPIAVAEFTL
jgi:hypothetical protein